MWGLKTPVVPTEDMQQSSAFGTRLPLTNRFDPFASQQQESVASP